VYVRAFGQDVAQDADDVSGIGHDPGRLRWWDHVDDRSLQSSAWGEPPDGFVDGLRDGKRDRPQGDLGGVHLDRRHQRIGERLQLLGFDLHRPCRLLPLGDAQRAIPQHLQIAFEHGERCPHLVRDEAHEAHVAGRPTHPYVRLHRPSPRSVET